VLSLFRRMAVDSPSGGKGYGPKGLYFRGLHAFQNDLIVKKQFYHAARGSCRKFRPSENGLAERSNVYHASEELNTRSMVHRIPSENQIYSYGAQYRSLTALRGQHTCCAHRRLEGGWSTIRAR